MFNWFKKKASSGIASEGTEKGKELFELLAEQLAGVIATDREELFKGARIAAEKGIVYIKRFNIEIHCHIVNQQQHPEVIVYCLGFLIRIDGVEVFYDELAAIGVDPFAAMLDGAASFNEGFLDGFFRSFFGCYEPSFDLNDIPGNKFHLVYSALQVQGAFKEDDSLTHEGLVNIVFPLIKDLFSQFACQEEYTFENYYWIKIYLSRQPNGSFIGECNFNNQEWAAGLQTVVQEDYEKWKKTDSFLAKKQFIFLRKCGVCCVNNL